MLRLATVTKLAARPRTTGPAHLYLRASPVFLRSISNIPVPKTSKVWDSPDEAIKDVKSGDIILCGGASSFLHLLLGFAN